MRNAFSLVELSIVLVILGLLTGGILAGQSLIRAAELRAVSTEYTRYITSVHTFRDKYFALPGDMTNATRFWGAADGSTGSTAGCWTTQGTGTTTCNGNGDGFIGNPNALPAERFRAWQQLANAGLIEGNYTGVSGSGSTYKHSVPGTNVPRSKLGQAGWTLRYILDSDTLPSGTADDFALSYNNVIEFGLASTTDTTQNPALKPEDLWNIDTKVDDGKPAQGRLIARPWGACTTAGAATTLTADYKLTDTAVQCSFVLRKL